MQPGRHSNEQEPFHDTVATINMFVVLLRAIGYIHELFTRRFGSLGREYPNGAVALIGIFFVPMLAVLVAPPVYGSEFLAPYYLLVILLAVIHGIAKQWQTRHVHRHYIGDPWIQIGQPGSRKGEWLLGWIIIAVFSLFSNTLGILHFVSLVCSAMNQDMIEARDKRIVRQMRDSQLEAEYYKNRLNY
jgi:hypothetical protein